MQNEAKISCYQELYSKLKEEDALSDFGWPSEKEHLDFYFKAGSTDITFRIYSNKDLMQLRSETPRLEYTDEENIQLAREISKNYYGIFGTAYDGKIIFNLSVPLPLLQLSRLDYGCMTPTTLYILDLFCQKIFRLQKEKEYFVKTGTFSSKYDFRNAHVQGEKEVNELGEYLLFIHNQACQMAGPLMYPCTYGPGTTRSWVVREYIKDLEGNPCIYKGMPLHTEYRVFVDFDTKEILGISSYWKPDIMKQRFGHEKDADSPHNIHDYIIYLKHEKVLMSRYEKYKDKIEEQVQKLLPDIPLTGQWSMDIMQNGTDFYIIDMALAVNSALIECVPKEKLKPIVENWLPQIQD